jgi:hypothetical protein
VLTALAGALRAGTGSQPAFVADEALAATDGATLASSAGAGLDMRGTGRGTGGAGDTIGAAPWLSFGGGTGTGTTCSYEELTTRTASMGRIAAIESCSVGRLGHGLATGTGSAHGPRAAPDALDGSPRHGSWNCRCSDDGARGSLARDVVRRVVARHRNEIRACYEHALVARPDLEGRVTARWIVAPDGRVQGASLDAARSDVRSSEIETCVTAAVARWTFPTSAAPTPVSYPFVLGHDA